MNRERTCAIIRSMPDLRGRQGRRQLTHEDPPPFCACLALPPTEVTELVAPSPCLGTLDDRVLAAAAAAGIALPAAPAWASSEPFFAPFRGFAKANETRTSVGENRSKQ